MNKLEFLTKMRNRLEKFGLPQDDINDALSYYEEVFLDAGFGKEEETAAELGDPVEIADGILRDSGIHTADASQFPPRFDETQVQNTANPNGGSSKSTENFWLKFILLILTFPIWLPIIITLFALLFALMVTVVAIVAALIISGIAFIISGVYTMIDVPPLGILMIGIGLMITGLFVIIGSPTLRKIIPACGSLIRGLVDWIRGLFAKRGGQKNV